MVLTNVLISYLSIIFGLNVISTLTAQPELKLVNVIFRHGDRTPDEKYERYPKDPHLNHTFYPEGLGQLTIEGKQREYKLGTILHDRYKKFLGDMYIPKIVVGHSSDYDRTKASLQLVLAGLFPPNDRQRWNDNILWQPIPTTYISRVNDNFFLSDECPKLLNELDRVLELPETRKILSQFDEMSKNLTELTGKIMSRPQDWYYLYHTFVTYSYLNLTLPKWAYDYYPNGQLFDAIVLTYNLYSYNPLLKRLNAGPIIRAMFDNMKAVQNSTSKTKIYLYSGHETNIAKQLIAFNVYKPHVPEFSSAVILELLQQDNQYYVKILHYRGIPPVIDELTIPGCDTLCSFDKFSDFIKDLIPSDEEMVCDKRKTADYANTEYPAAIYTKLYKNIKLTELHSKSIHISI
ncbi:venom acid phosphatase Acph-1-like [Pseudomyrmex gracilis]|uniref:venom acid phosphatase Acph-1-like n=1 Tax=Pseudomyrmex gracilis TaxID=219809 RepID=UPI000995B48F|nr:venom acid phosphatase Acph-1-like [Pseudomyrmex gracilis]